MFISGVLYADGCDVLSEAFKSGNSSTISKFLNKTVDLTITGIATEEIYPKAKAEQLIKNFFSKNSPKSFTIIHKGSSKEGTRFVIGTLTTSGGSFRTHFIVKNVNGQDFLEELKIEKE
jgi:hypothetical protein